MFQNQSLVAGFLFPDQRKMFVKRECRIDINKQSFNFELSRIRYFRMKKPGYAHIMVILLLMLTACRHPQTQDLCEQESGISHFGKVFLVGEQMIESKALNDIIRVSGLSTRGYSVVLTSGDLADSKEISGIINALNYFKILANHVISVNDSLQITKANEIAIRNAEVIFLAFNSRASYASFLADTALVQSIKSAKENGKTVVGVGPGAGLLGETTVISILNPQTSATEVITAGGLNLLPGTMVDKNRFFINHKEMVLKYAAENPHLFIGVGNRSFVQYCSDALSVKKSESLLIIKDGKLLEKSEVEKLKKLKLIHER